MNVIIPKALADSCRKSQAGAVWLEYFPEVIVEFQRRWSLTPGAPFRSPGGSCSWAAPVTCADGSNAVLKIGLPHMEAELEIDVLRFWNGRGTVRLLKVYEEYNVMLLEACEPGTTLRSLPEAEQDDIIGELFPQFWRTPPDRHRFRLLSDMLSCWKEETLADADAGRIKLSSARD